MSGYRILGQHRSWGLFSREKTEDPKTRDARQQGHYGTQGTVSAHTQNADGLDAATSTLFRTGLQKCQQPVLDPPGKRLECSLLRNVTILQEQI